MGMIVSESTAAILRQEARRFGRARIDCPTLLEFPMTLRSQALVLAASALLLGACAGGMQGGPTATAKLEPTRGNAAAGMVTFRQAGERTLMQVRIEGLKPGQEHGFHVHEKGDCSSGDGMSTGGHFNPKGKPHGKHEDMERHAGDLPSLKADANGRVDQQFSLSGLSIGGGDTDIVGRGLIVHAMPDDYKTQPTGNSGARIACALIVRQGM
jgi:Cu-Zn family superoxide dismutase